MATTLLILAAQNAALAASDLDWFKLVPFAIAVIIWIIGAIAKSVDGAAKRPEQTWTGDPADNFGTAYSPPPPIPQQYAPPQQYSPPPPIPSRWSPPPLAPPVPGHGGLPSGWPPAERLQVPADLPRPSASRPWHEGGPPVVPPLPTNRAKPGKKRRAGTVAPALPPRAAEERILDVAPKASAFPPPPARRAAPVGPRLTAAGVRRWLTPATLKQQYILTEVFDPPPSARS